MSKQKFEIWSEGFKTTGMTSNATFHGLFNGESFKDAVKNFKDRSTEGDHVDLTNLTFWGCKLFDNETEARKRHG